MTITPKARKSYKKGLSMALKAVCDGAECAYVPCSHPWGAVRYVRHGSRIARQIMSDAGKTLAERLLPIRPVSKSNGNSLTIWNP